MRNDSSKKREIKRFFNRQYSKIRDDIAIEVPLTIYVNGAEFATMLCTPTHLKELAVGFLASEGIIRTVTEIDELLIDKEKGFVYVELKNKQSFNPSFLTKRVIGSCCGKSRQFYFQSDVQTAKTVFHSTTLTVHQCIRLMEELQKCSDRKSVV